MKLKQIVFVCLSLLAGFGPGFADEYAKLEKKAVGLIQKGRADKAFDLFQQAVRQFPSEGRAHLSYGSALFAQGFQLHRQGHLSKGLSILDQAEQELRAASDILGRDPANHSLTAQCHYFIGELHFFIYDDLKKARNYYESALELDPKFQPAMDSLQLLESERLRFDFDTRRWMLGRYDDDGYDATRRYVLENENLSQWSELVTVQAFRGRERVTVAEWLDMARSMMTRQCPDLHWNVIRQDEGDVLYEWSISNCPDLDDQSEIARVVEGRAGIHVLHYAIQQVSMPPARREEWIKLLQQARLA